LMRTLMAARGRRQAVAAPGRFNLDPEPGF
jgi:hypothetical protein